MLRILITGGSGQLGSELRRCLRTMRAEIGPIPESYRYALVDYPRSSELNIADEGSVRAWFADNRYDLVINCAAFTNVDGSETDEDSAEAVNTDGAGNIAAAAAKQGAKLVHISTDYVFPGDDPHPRKETDEVGPVNAYGRTKYAGETQARIANRRTFVVRTAWLYGYEGRNFVKTMHRLGAERDSVTVVDDQLGNPTSANDVAYEILKIALTENYGIYHCTNNGVCSWAEFAAAIMEAFGHSCQVVPVSSEQYRAANPASVKRPAFSSLDNSRLAVTIGDEMRPWREALASYVGNFAELAD